ncbi:MAG: DUF3908 family protein [Sedimentibacter sp.]
MNLNFTEIMNYLEKNRFSESYARKYFSLFKKVSQIINEENILFFYPKFLFVNDKPIQLYFILKNHMLINVSIKEDKQMIVEFLNVKNNIRKINYQCSLDDYGGTTILTVLFEDNFAEIVFNSEEDSNENWKYDFEKVLCDIAKYFINISDFEHK